MAQKAYTIAFSGTDVDSGFYADVLALTVDERLDDATVMHLKLALRKQSDGSWTYLGDGRLAPLTPVSVKIGFTSGSGLAGALGAVGALASGAGNDGLIPVFSGYVTEVTVQLDSHPSQGSCELTASDASVLLGSEEKIATWPDLADSDIVTQIVASYGIAVQADTTTTVHQQDVTTVVQRATDLQFVRTLARRNGLEFYFATDQSSGETVAFFKAPALGGSPLPDLAIQFGEDSNLRTFQTHLTAQRPLNVKTAQLDAASANTSEAQAGSDSLDLLGSNDLDGIVSGPLGGLVTAKDALAQLLVLGSPTSDQGELRTIAQAVRDEAGWFIDAAGEINSDAYQAVLRPHRVVLVKGAGSQYSGKYYVSRVSHAIKADGSYAQTFEARRNARDLDGSESFGGSGLQAALPSL